MQKDDGQAGCVGGSFNGGSQAILWRAIRQQDLKVASVIALSCRRCDKFSNLLRPVKCGGNEAELHQQLGSGVDVLADGVLGLLAGLTHHEFGQQTGHKQLRAQNHRRQEDEEPGVFRHQAGSHALRQPVEL